MSAPTASRKSKTPFWVKALLFIVVMAAFGGAGLFVGKALGADEERTAQVLRSIRGEEQVILVTAGISDKDTAKEDGKFLDIIDLPWNERKTTIMVDYNAKFGIEGKEVKIVSSGVDSYVITIPEFKGLGISDPVVTLATESNGILSWSTPEIDQNELVTELISQGASEKHIDASRPLLKEQAELFYSRIVKSINPDATIEFVFAGSTTAD